MLRLLRRLLALRKSQNGRWGHLSEASHGVGALEIRFGPATFVQWPGRGKRLWSRKHAWLKPLTFPMRDVVGGKHETSLKNDDHQS